MRQLTFAILAMLAASSVALAQPATLGVLDLNVTNPSSDGALHAADTVSWWEVVHPGGATPFLGVDSCGSDFDTEIGLYDSVGNLVANNDDACGLQSIVGEILPAGSYFAAVAGFNTEFNANFDVVPGTDEGNILINAEASPPPPPPPVTATFDLNAANMDMDVQTLGSEEIVWYEILHPGGELTVTTTFPETTLLGAFSPDFPDTEIGLYNDVGVLVASNDDEDFDAGILTSLLVEDLPAGTYYAATGGWNSFFLGGFDASSANPNTGDIKLSASVVPEPAAMSLLMVAMFGLIGIRRR